MPKYRYLSLLQNMGMRYVIFRAVHEILRRSGALKYRFPTRIQEQNWISLSEWQKCRPRLFKAAEALLTPDSYSLHQLNSNANSAQNIIDLNNHLIEKE